jgi:hypothetical protein
MSRLQHPTDEITVTATPTVDADTGDALWHLYLQAFEGLRARAASRHTLTRAEFDLEALDERVMKYVAWRCEAPVGLVTLTTDLTTVPWISPDFYAARYPHHAARGAIFYCSLALVDPAERLTDVFARMVGPAADAIAAAGGVLAADMCRLNVEVVELSRAVTTLLRRRWGGVEPVELDRQVFLAWEPTLASRAAALPAPRPAGPES